MFGDHILDFFGPTFDSWLEENKLLLECISYSDIEILSDDHPGHQKSLEDYMEDQELAFAISSYHLFYSKIVIGSESAKVLEISKEFPESLLAELKSFAPGFTKQ